MTLIPPPLQHTPNLPLPPNEPPDSYWRSLYYFNDYRFIVALLLLSIVAIFGNSLAFGSMIFELFVYVSAGYVMFSTLCFLLIASRRRFQLQLGLQVSADILFIVVLMFASGGIPSGLGLLLLSGLAAAGASRPRGKGSDPAGARENALQPHCSRQAARHHIPGAPLPHGAAGNKLVRSEV